MKVQYIIKDKYNEHDLTNGNVYEVIGIEADYYRILDDNNKPYLYSPNLFKIVESIEPSFWISEYGKNGERYAYPHSWNQPGFFEAYHDNIQEVISLFWSEHKKLYSTQNN